MLEVKELVITDLKLKGSGANLFSPVRTITEVYDKEGNCLAINDSMGNYSIEDMFSFVDYADKYGRGTTTEIWYEIFKDWKENK